jgi:hypothetical protein
VCSAKSPFEAQSESCSKMSLLSAVNLWYRYHRMDGSTAVGVRARLVDDFNNNDSVFVFLLTTKVGGLGINLTGADRCVAYPLACCTLGLPFFIAQNKNCSRCLELPFSALHIHHA